jgi:hypothetical protein
LGQTAEVMAFIIDEVPVPPIDLSGQYKKWQIQNQSFLQNIRSLKEAHSDTESQISWQSMSVPSGVSLLPVIQSNNEQVVKTFETLRADYKPWPLPI